MTKRIFDITEFGAVTGGGTPCTASIQKAIDVCAEAGGGQVYVPAGIFLIGTICLRSNVELHLAAGTTLLASSECDVDRSGYYGYIRGNRDRFTVKGRRTVVGRRT